MERLKELIELSKWVQFQAEEAAILFEKQTGYIWPKKKCLCKAINRAALKKMITEWKEES